MLLAVAGGTRDQDADRAALKDLAGLHRSLEKGMKAYLGGTAAAEAWPDWTSRAPAPLAGKLKDAGVASASPLGFELQVSLAKGNRPVYELGTYIVTHGGKVRFAAFSGSRVPEGDGNLRGLTLEKCTGPSKPFADGVRGILSLTKPDVVPIADADGLTDAVPFEPARRELAKMIEETKRGLEKTCTGLAGAGADTVRVGVDDISFVARDAEGKSIGILRAEFRLTDDGAVKFELGRYRAFPK